MCQRNHDIEKEISWLQHRLDVIENVVGLRCLEDYDMNNGTIISKFEKVLCAAKIEDPSQILSGDTLIPLEDELVLKVERLYKELESMEKMMQCLNFKNRACLGNIFANFVSIEGR